MDATSLEAWHSLERHLCRQSKRICLWPLLLPPPQPCRLPWPPPDAEWLRWWWLLPSPPPPAAQLPPMLYGARLPPDGWS